MAKEDITYCSSSFLMYRAIINQTKTFSLEKPAHMFECPSNREKVHNSKDLYLALKHQVEEICCKKKAALCLSGGIDSAILAKLVPKGTPTYTFKCVVPGMEVVDETPTAKKYAKECGLENKVIEIYWEDFEKYAPILMKHKGAPIHSIEVQMYKASLEAKKDGIEVLIFGESADCLYGGLSLLLSQDWTVGEFIDRYAYVKPYQVLKDFYMELDPIINHQKDGYVDVHSFLSNVFFKESINSYLNACETAGMECLMPYANTILDEPLNLQLIRDGENKYLIREIFKDLYDGFVIPPKTPMPRPMNEWLKNWKGPIRPEFWPNCHINMTGDQKWLIWALEKYLNIIDKD